MPHLPTHRVIGGSVKIRIPVTEVDAYDKPTGDPLFKKNRKPVIESCPPKSKKRYAFEEYSAADTKAQIYKIEIHGADKDEVFEFHPKNGKCTIEVYFATSDELPLTHDDNWLEAKK